MVLQENAETTKVKLRVNALLSDPTPTAAAELLDAVDKSSESLRRQALATLESYVQSQEGGAPKAVVSALVALRRA